MLSYCLVQPCQIRTVLWRQGFTELCKRNQKRLSDCAKGHRWWQFCLQGLQQNLILLNIEDWDSHVLAHMEWRSIRHWYTALTANSASFFFLTPFLPNNRVQKTPFGTNEPLSGFWNTSSSICVFLELHMGWSNYLYNWFYICMWTKVCINVYVNVHFKLFILWTELGFGIFHIV